MPELDCALCQVEYACGAEMLRQAMGHAGAESHHTSTAFHPPGRPHSHRK